MVSDRVDEVLKIECSKEKSFYCGVPFSALFRCVAA